MPVAEELRAVLAEAAQAPAPAEQTPAELRARERELIPAETGPGDPVAAVRDVLVPREGGPSVPVRIYRPAEAGELPAVVYLHGGGWVTGSLDTVDALCRRLCRAARAVVASVDYRLAPEHPFPCGLDDGEAALEWLARAASTVGVDPGRLAVAGDSAGGNLAAVLARRARDAGGPPLAAQVLIYPALDPLTGSRSFAELAEGYGLTRASMRWYWRQYLGESHGGGADVAPGVADLAGLPPAIVLVAEYDPLRDEGEAYAEALRRAGVPVVLRREPGMIHGFARWLALTPRAGEALDALGAGLADLFARPAAQTAP